MLGVSFGVPSWSVALVRLDEDENVVDADGKDEEGNNLEDDEGGADADEAEDSDRSANGEEDDEDTADAKGDLALNLEEKKKSKGISCVRFRGKKHLYLLE